MTVVVGSQCWHISGTKRVGNDLEVAVRGKEPGVEGL